MGNKQYYRQYWTEFLGELRPINDIYINFGPETPFPTPSVTASPTGTPNVTSTPTVTPSVTQTNTPSPTPFSVCPERLNISNRSFTLLDNGPYDRVYYSGDTSMLYGYMILSGTSSASPKQYYSGTAPDGNNYPIYMYDRFSPFPEDNVNILARTFQDTLQDLGWGGVECAFNPFTGGTLVPCGISYGDTGFTSYSGVRYPKMGLNNFNTTFPGSFYLSYEQICPTTTPTPSVTNTSTPSNTPTQTVTSTVTNTPSVTQTSTPTNTNTQTQTSTTTPTVTPTKSPLPFAPTDVSDLFQWWDAASGSTLQTSVSGGATYVDTWDARIGNAVAQAQSARRPQLVSGLYGFPYSGITFSGTNIVLTGTTSGNTPSGNTVFLVGYGIASTNALTFSIDSSNGEGIATLYINANTLEGRVAGRKISWGIWNTRTCYPNIFMYLSGGTSSGSGLLNRLTPSSTATTFTAGATMTNIRMSDLTANSDGALFEILVYNRVLNSTERANVQNYLENKWNYGVCLPVSPTPTQTSTQTSTPSNSPSNTPSNSPTNTPSVTQTSTPQITQTNTPSVTQTSTPTVTQTITPTVTQTNTSTPSVTPTNTISPTPSVTPPSYCNYLGIFNTSSDIIVTNVEISGVSVSYISGTDFGIYPGDPQGDFGNNISGSSVTVRVYYNTAISGQKITITDCDEIIHCSPINTGNSFQDFTVNLSCGCSWTINAEDGSC